MSPPKKTSPVGELIKGLTRIFDSGQGSDLKIECNALSWAVHSLILCTQSEFFNAACTGGFKESTSRVIKLQDELPGMVERMVSYFYKLDYSDTQMPPPLVSDTHDISPLDTNVKMYAMGEKYGIAGLKQLALDKFAVAFDCVKARDLGQFLFVIPDVYSSTPDIDDGLRNLVVSLPTTTKDCYKRLMVHPELKSTIIQTPPFALGLMIKTASQMKERWCENCSQVMGIQLPV